MKDRLMDTSKVPSLLKEERKARRIKKRKAEIVSAAKGVFLTEEYKDVTMESLARAADISKATLYLYFKTKSDIYHDLLVSDLQLLIDDIVGAEDEALSAPQVLMAKAWKYADFFQSHTEYFSRLSFYYYPGRAERLAADVAREIERLIVVALRSIEATIARGTAAGELRSLNPWATAVALWALWEGAAQAAATGRTERFDLELRKIVEAGMSAMIKGIRKTSRA